MHKTAALSIIILVLAIGPYSFASGSKAVSANLAFDPASVSFNPQDGYDIVSLGGRLVYNLPQPGEPALPSRIITVLAPADSIFVSAGIGGKTEINLGICNVYPQQEDYPIDDMPEDPFTDPDPAIYNSENIFPANNITFLGKSLLHGHMVFKFAVCPFSWNPETKELALFSEMNIGITYQYAEMKSISTRDADRIRSMIRGCVNFEQYIEECNAFSHSAPSCGSAPLPAPGGETYQLLIATSTELRPAFEELANHRIKQGINTKIVTLADWNTYTGQDEAEKLRNLIIDYYQNNGLEYVCLGGGGTGYYVDGSTYGGQDSIVPIRWAGTHYDGDVPVHLGYPSDYYYACLDGTWNANGDEWFATTGDDVDYLPEVNVGRISVDTLAQAQAYVTKLIRYETDAATTDYVKKFLGAGVKSFSIYEPGSWGGNDLDHPASDTELYVRDMWAETLGCSSHSFTGTPYYLTDTFTSWDSTVDGDYACSVTHMIDVLSQGFYHINFGGHGWWIAIPNMEDCPEFPIAGGHNNFCHWHAENNLTNYRRPSIVWSNACDTGMFDGPETCVAEGFIRNPYGGAIAYFGNARVAYSSSNKQHPRAFYWETENAPHTLGAAYMRVQAQLLGGSWSSCWAHGMATNLIGAPMAPIYTDNPSVFSPTFSSSLPLGTQTVTVNTGVPSALVCLSMDNQIIVTGNADGSGVYTAVNVPLNTVGTVDLVITAHNKLRYNGTIEVGSNQPPAKAIAINPANSATSISTGAQLQYQAGGASSYDVYFGTTNPPSLLQADVTATQIDPGLLGYTSVYYWRVDAKNANGTTTGDMWSFTTMDQASANPPEAVAGVIPSDGAIEQTRNVNLDWQDSAGADGYYVYFGASYPPQYVKTESQSVFDPGTLQYSTIYYWKLIAYNVYGNSTEVFGQFTTLDEPVSLPDQAYGPSPFDGATGVSITGTIFSWSATGAESYRLYIGTTNPPPLVCGSLTNNAVQISGLIYSTNYYWKIDTVNNSGSTPGVVWSLTTQDDPNVGGGGDPGTGGTPQEAIMIKKGGGGGGCAGTIGRADISDEDFCGWWLPWLFGFAIVICLKLHGRIIARLSFAASWANQYMARM
ncbi:MAG: C25 family cysteine peptidase [Planctomycetota bacterium]|jgi:hypothetical protein